MKALVDGETRVLIQGITGQAARLHTRIMREYGTQIVAGVRPGAGGQRVEGMPVFDAAADAVEGTGANAAVLFVPARFVKAAAFETLEAGVRLLVMVPEHVPLHDTMAIVERSEALGARVVGPNTPGLIRPSARCKLGFLPERYFMEGPVGVASRSGTLNYELVARLTEAGIGQSTVVGVGGDPIVGSTFSQILDVYEADPDTRVMLMVGEIGGGMEEEVAERVQRGELTKPIVVFLAGRNAPKGKRMGHAGAIIAAGRGSIESKLEALGAAGIPVADQPADVVPLVQRALAS